MASSESHPLIPHRNLSANLTGTLVRTGKGDICALQITNTAAAIRYVKFYDKATAGTASDTPVLTFAIPAGQMLQFPVEDGLHFYLGISYRASNAAADADATAPTAGDVLVNLGYR